jgi:hypothetical protein
MGRPRYFYKMFRMSVEIFTALHDLLVFTNGLTSTNNISFIESLAMFLWIVGGPQLFSQAENRFTRSVHEVLKYMRKLGKDNIIPRDSTFSTNHARVRENHFYHTSKVQLENGLHVKVVVPVDEMVNHTCRHGYTSQNVLAIYDFNMRFTFVVAGWPGAAHDTRILNHALANFSSFPVPPKDMHGTSFPSFYVSYTSTIYFASLAYFYKKILSRRFGLSEPNRVSCALQRKHVSYTRISALYRLSSRKVQCVQFLAFVPSKYDWKVFWSLEAEVAYFEEYAKFLTSYSEAYNHDLLCFA